MNLYVIRNTLTGKEYVGMTKHALAERMSRHKHSAFKRNEGGPLYEAMRKDGIAAFRMELLAEAMSRNQLERLERDAIRERHTLQPAGYNVAMGGRGSWGRVLSQDTREKISQSRQGQSSWNAGKQMSAEYKAAASIAQMNRFRNEQATGLFRHAWNKGIAHSAETRAQMRASHLARGTKPPSSIGLKRSAETCARIAENKRQFHARRRRERELYADFT